MSDSIRAFIAIELNKDIQDSLAKIQSQLRAARADVKWVKPENIHLTLKFIGNIEIDLVIKIKEILQEISKIFQNVPADLNELGAFPKIKNPRVIWVGMQTGKDKVIAILEELEKRLAEIGIAKEEKEFHPHVTLGRLRSPHNRSDLVAMLEKNIKIPPLNFTIDKIVLFKSALAPQGPIYEPQAEVSLKAS
ncbi:MAG: RNA 2',3'-cyclic phosphodiesterase [Candidatus Omnitrophica bacterium]|nr:RNA 2',3'-cyclic phosphodiesterase [Candidatus Omnitrophota bacterium]